MIFLWIVLGIFVLAGTVGFVYILHEADMISPVHNPKNRRSKKNHKSDFKFTKEEDYSNYKEIK